VKKSIHLVGGKFHKKAAPYELMRRTITPHSSLLRKIPDSLLTQSGIHGIIISVAARAAAPSGPFRKELQKSA
jgi:hypothetical protein